MLDVGSPHVPNTRLPRILLVPDEDVPEVTDGFGEGAIPAPADSTIRETDFKAANK